MTNEKMPENAQIFYCKICDFSCSKQSNYQKHLLTAKHKRRTNTNKKMPENAEKKFICFCGKKYLHASSLWNHKKKCDVDTNLDLTVNEDTHQLDMEVDTSEGKKEPIVEYLLRENLEMKQESLEMKKLLVDLCHKIEPVSNQTNNINTNNNIFNINLFLNEECKDAMNMTDFIDSIQLSIDDVEKIGTEGQTQAISNILMNKLNELDIVKRPVHCSDAKKEIIYVKDEDRWEKEPKDRPRLKKALDKITMESMYKIPDITPNEDNYAHTLSEIMKEPREDRKILSKVSKGVLIKS